MKLQYLFGFIVVGWSCLCYGEDIEDQQLRHIEQSTTFDMVQDFRVPKNVLFSCLVGGSSHVHWVLSILNELESRGHNTTYITKVRLTYL